MIGDTKIISQLRRQLTLSRVAQNTLLIIAGLAVLLSVFEIGPANLGLLLLGLILFTWISLTVRSLRAWRDAADVPALIAAGHYAEAEHRLSQLLKGFSLLRNPKLQGMHQLLLLRHAQRRWQDAVELSRALLSQKLGNLREVTASAQLVLADSLLELGDLRGAYDAIANLYNRRLMLAQAIGLLRVQLDYSARLGLWEQMLQGAGEKVRLCELMSTSESARSQALLALAANHVGRHELSQWLQARALLLMPREQLLEDRPILAGLF